MGLASVVLASVLEILGLAGGIGGQFIPSNTSLRCLTS
jgi:hypothetical protein